MLGLLGDVAGSGHSTLWSYLLPSLHWQALGHGQHQGPVQLPPMQADLQTSTLSGQEHRADGGHGEAESQEQPREQLPLI